MHEYVHAFILFHIVPIVLLTKRSHTSNVDPNVMRMHHQSRLMGQMESMWDMLGPQTDK